MTEDWTEGRVKELHSDQNFYMDQILRVKRADQSSEKDGREKALKDSTENWVTSAMAQKQGGDNEDSLLDVHGRGHSCSTKQLAKAVFQACVHCSRK